MSELAYVGKSVPRVDAPEKVTGRAVFTLDLQLPRMLTGKLKASEVPHAKIKNIDTSRAEALPGVLAGIIFTFVPMLGDTVVAQHMGGNNVHLLSAQVQSLIGVSNFFVAAALAAVVLAIMLAFQVLLWAALRPVGGLNEVFASLRR